MSKPIIEIRNISKEYKISHRLMNNANPTIKDDVAYWLKKPLEWVGAIHGIEKESFMALDNVSFDVEKGDVVGIMGKNGSGKSTLFKILSQITEPTAGTASLRGRVASLLEVGTGFHPELTGRENVYFNGSILGMTKAEIDKEFDDIVAFSEVEKFLDTPTKFYSSGMKVRLAFSVAAHLKPEILLIDEVLAVGDVRFKQKSIEHMKKVANAGTTILFVSHIIHQIEQICTSGVLLSHGKLVQQGKISDTIEEYLALNEVSEDVSGNDGGSADYSKGAVGEKISIIIKRHSVEVGSDGLPRIAIELQLRNRTSSDSPDLWLGAFVADRLGNNILKASNEQLGKSINVKKGSHKNIRIELSGVSLMPDKYSLRVNLRTMSAGKQKEIFHRIELKDVIKIPTYNIGHLSQIGPGLSQSNPPLVVDHNFVID